METPRDDRLAEELRVLRPAPRPEFAAELDERAATGFPRRSRLPRLPPARWGEIRPRRLLIPAGGLAVVAIAISTAVISTSGPNELTTDEGGVLGPLAPADSRPGPEPAQLDRYSAEVPVTPEQAAGGAGGGSSATQGGSLTYSGPTAAGAESLNGAFNRRNRAVERSAELVLSADPADVADDAAEVFKTVHAHDGIVMRSSSREGNAGQAGARFELLIPSAKLSDALAALSAIDEVRSRHEATTDITAPTVNVGELLQDSKARIDSLLAQLEGAETESEREAVEAELSQERRHRARLRAQLQHLQRRADLSRVLVRIETGASEQPPSEGGAWGIDDALGDAGRILAVAAAVAVVGLAVLGPIALIALLAWLTHRAWVRRERRRVLS
jgi:hypothetical protein